MFASMEVINDEAVKELFNSYSIGKIKRVRVGKLYIGNVFYTKFKDSGLTAYEEHYVFYALEKRKTSFFSAPTYRLFIWPVESNTIFYVPTDSVFCERPKKDSEICLLLSKEFENRSVCTEYAYNAKHKCILEKMCLYRSFAVSDKKIVALKDWVAFHCKWTKPDPWIRRQPTYKKEYSPMYFLRNSPENVFNDLHPSYPQRPDLFGYEIDEN